MKKILFLVLLSISAVSYSQNFAYVQQDSILASIPTYKTSIESIDKASKGYQEEIQKAKAELSDKLQNLLKPYNVKENENLATIKARMSKIDTTSLGIMMEDDKIIQKKAKNYDSNLKLQYQREIQPSLDKVNAAIKSFATKNKIDVIYILEQLRPALAYIDEKKNITKKIVESLK